MLCVSNLEKHSVVSYKLIEHDMKKKDKDKQPRTHEQLKSVIEEGIEKLQTEEMRK